MRKIELLKFADILLTLIQCAYNLQSLLVRQRLEKIYSNVNVALDFFNIHDRPLSFPEPILQDYIGT